LSACWGTRSPSIPCQESSESAESDGDGEHNGTAGGGSCWPGLRCLGYRAVYLGLRYRVSLCKLR
jgi:hypothetical protein